MFLWVTILLTLCAATTHGARLPGSKLPRYITACYIDDPKLDECALKNGREALPSLIKGDRKFRVPVLDPLHIVEIKLERGATNLGLDINMKDVQVLGLKRVSLDTIHLDPKAKHIEFSTSIPVMQILSTYSIAGSILILPITGTGPGNITLLDTTTKFTVDYDLKINPKDGKEYMSLKDHKLTFNTQKAIIQLDNLFNGDKLLGPSTNQFLNDNWRELVGQVGPLLADALAEVMTQILSILAEQVPFDDVVPLTPKKTL